MAISVPVMYRFAPGSSENFDLYCSRVELLEPKSIAIPHDYRAAEWNCSR